jgi:hypothetical protein
LVAEWGRCDNAYLKFVSASGETTTLHWNASSHGTVGMYLDRTEIIPFGASVRIFTEFFEFFTLASFLLYCAYFPTNHSFFVSPVHASLLVGIFSDSEGD